MAHEDAVRMTFEVDDVHDAFLALQRIPLLERGAHGPIHVTRSEDGRVTMELFPVVDDMADPDTPMEEAIVGELRLEVGRLEIDVIIVDLAEDLGRAIEAALGSRARYVGTERRPFVRVKAMSGNR